MGGDMEKIYSKKTILFVSIFMAAIAIVSGLFEPFRLCGDSWRSCMDLNFAFSQLIFPSLPLFIFSTITFFLRDSVFHAWARFAVPATILSMLAIFFMQDSGSGGFGPQLSFGKGDVALITGLLFVVISIVIIVREYLRRAK